MTPIRSILSTMVVYTCSGMDEVTYVFLRSLRAIFLPPRDKNFGRTIAYLIQTRGIDKEIVLAMIEQGKVYGAKTEREEDCFYNCAFVGYDESGTPRYCAMRASSADSHFRKDVENSGTLQIIWH